MKRRNDYYPNTETPSLFWRVSSYQTLLTVHLACRTFLFGLNKTEVHGLPRFLDLLKSRADYRTRSKGLVTVSNHISVMDDPLIWGCLPLSFAAYYSYQNHRWSFGSHDICFTGPTRSMFFILGQTLPTHRLAHSPYGGPTQPSLIEGVRLLSKISTTSPSWCPWYTQWAAPSRPPPNQPHWPSDCVDPFSDLPRYRRAAYSSAPTDARLYHAPSRYASNSYSWVHIFPEGMIHQSDDKTMRYFKWGVSRLILEPEECPDVVPIFIEGTDQVMHESRTWPRFIPRTGKNIIVTFGAEVDTEATFGDLRKRYRELVTRVAEHPINTGPEAPEWCETQAADREKSLGLLLELGMEQMGNEGWEEKLREELRDLRIECTRRVREEVLKVRRSRGLCDEDPKCGLVETWVREGPKREGEMKDGSWVKDT